jgi:hypothetical protein
MAEMVSNIRSKGHLNPLKASNERIPQLLVKSIDFKNRI